MRHACRDPRIAVLDRPASTSGSSRNRLPVYGMIHQAARELAVSHIGEAEWDRFCKTHGIVGAQFLGFEYYDDAITLRLIDLVADRLGLERDVALVEFGRTWIRFASKSAFGRVLSLAGNDLETFLDNLDRMHASIKSNMPQAEMPSFQILEARPDAIRLLYRSSRIGLAPFVAGILAEVALRFGERISVTHAPSDLGVEFTLSRMLAHARL